MSAIPFKGTLLSTEFFFSILPLPLTLLPCFSSVSIQNESELIGPHLVFILT